MARLPALLLALCLAPALAASAPRAPWRIFLDPGHGAPGNTGNRGVLCEDEEAHTLRVARVVAARLEATKRFTVRLSRSGATRPTYADRVAAAQAFGADAFVSLHSDDRGAASPWEPAPGTICQRSDTDPGFAVLLSDEGPAPLVARRRTLAQAVANHLSSSGFTAYVGPRLDHLYARDPVAGVFVDRRPAAQRVFLLRQPTMPSVIVETHHALDLAENARWLEPRTHETFADALAAALEEALRSPDP